MNRTARVTPTYRSHLHLPLGCDTPFLSHLNMCVAMSELRALDKHTMDRFAIVLCLPTLSMSRVTLTRVSMTDSKGHWRPCPRRIVALCMTTGVDSASRYITCPCLVVHASHNGRCTNVYIDVMCNLYPGFRCSDHCRSLVSSVLDLDTALRCTYASSAMRSCVSCGFLFAVVYSVIVVL